MDRIADRLPHDAAANIPATLTASIVSQCDTGNAFRPGCRI
jgi:hypothetical protein